MASASLAGACRDLESIEALLDGLDALQPLVDEGIADEARRLLLLLFLLLFRSGILRLVGPPFLLLSSCLGLGVDLCQLGGEWVHLQHCARVEP